MRQKKLWMLAAIRPLVLTIVFCGATELQAQSLRGTVADAMTGEPLIVFAGKGKTISPNLKTHQK